MRMVQQHLGKPERSAKRVARQWSVEVRAMRSEVRELELTLTGLAQAAHARVVDLENAAELDAYVAGRGCGVVVACMHYGGYLHGVIAVLSTLQRDVLILRRKAAGPFEASVMQNAATVDARVEFLSTNSRMAYRKVLQWLADGGVVLTFFDLPRTWGRCREVRVLGQPMCWVSGPVEAAYHGRAALAPCRFPRLPSGRMTRCDVGEILDFSDGHMERDTAVALASQRLADFGSAAITADPPQWHNWPLVPEMVGQN